MKPCFLKLTPDDHKDVDVWINMHQIEAMERKVGHAVTLLSSVGDEPFVYRVAETPEQIINMLKAVK